MKVLISFLKKAEGDGRIGPSHISLYVALLMHAGDDPALYFVIYRKEIMQFAKIKARQTYTKRLQELHSFGYLEYVPSHDPVIGTKVLLK